MNLTPSIPQQEFEQLLKHAQALEKHGKRFQEMTIMSPESRWLTSEQAEHIDQIGQQVQIYGQVVATVAERALANEQYLIEEYVVVHQQCRQALRLHFEAIEVMSQALESLKLSQLKKHLDERTW